MNKYHITLVFLVFMQDYPLNAKSNPNFMCKIPFSPNTKSVPIYNKKTNRFEGNCRVYGDKGSSICHAPNEKPKKLSRLFNITDYDKLFFSSQKVTGISWQFVKSFVYQETSFIKRYVDISRITSSDGLGVGYMQLTKRDMSREIRYMKKYFTSYSGGGGRTITKDSVFRNELHHIILGTSWLMHKFKVRTKWSSKKAGDFVNEIALNYKNTQSGWGLREAKEEPFIYNKMKEAVTAYNGLASGCVVNGIVLTSYGNMVEYYYNNLIKKGGKPIPFLSYDTEYDVEEYDVDIPSNVAAESVHNYSGQKTVKLKKHDLFSISSFSIGL